MLLIYTSSTHPRFVLIHYSLGRPHTSRGSEVAVRTPSNPLKWLRIRTAIRRCEQSARNETERIPACLLFIADDATQRREWIKTGSLATGQLRASHAALIGRCERADGAIHIC
jgi:hypothetical protein